MTTGQQPPGVDVVSSLGSSYVPSEVEDGLYAQWRDRGYFTGDPESDGDPFLIVIPPPNVTGSLHMGHAFEHTLIDATIRRRRMQGYDAVWLPGMDHAGIATQTVVERQLAGEGVTRHDLGRDEFVRRVWQWKDTSGGRILDQMRRLGDSVDWSRERFTMDPQLSRAVRTMFKRLFDDGLIYRAERIINWCPKDTTALSDIEVDYQEDEGELVELVYGGGEAGPEIVVATTRVETMLGDTAIAVHPEDPRYKDVIGQHVQLPLVGRSIPIVADEHVDPEFGTGAVKVTPAHDSNDFEIAGRHSLPAIAILTESGEITGTGTEFDGLDRSQARVAVKEALRALGRVRSERRPYLHSVGHCSRCKSIIEPRLSMQWFVHVESLARAAGDAVRSGEVTVVPADMESRWFAWVDDMHDWCISRQLWWGHQIPVWYGPDGDVVSLGPDEEAPAGYVQDPDVLDTWFSSALWPFSTLGWPDRTADLARYYPNAAVITGYDILFFWVARMMMFGLYAMDGRPPFRQIVLHGMVRDEHGRKMSKSFGNVVDPLEWMDAYGVDALRLTLARGANPGADVPIGQDWVQGSRNFCTKLFNAVRFTLLKGATATTEPPSDGLSIADQWILSRLAEITAQVDEAYEDYEFAKVSETLYHFVWDEVCDWYLELAKVHLTNDSIADSTAGVTGSADAARATLGHVFDRVLRLLHPIMPFLSERLWRALQPVGAEDASLIVAEWPPRTTGLDSGAVSSIQAAQELVTAVRRFRADQGIPTTAPIQGLVATPEPTVALYVQALAGLAQPTDDFMPSITLETAGGRIDLDPRGSIDVDAARARAKKDLDAAQALFDASAKKLANPKFVDRAPAEVVQETRNRITTSTMEIGRIRERLEALEIMASPASR